MTRKWRLTSGLCSTYESSETDPVRREWVTRCVGRGGFFIGHHLPLGYDPPAYALSLTQVISLAGSIVEDPLSFHQSTALPSTRKHSSCRPQARNRVHLRLISTSYARSFQFSLTRQVRGYTSSLLLTSMSHRDLPPESAQTSYDLTFRLSSNPKT